MKTTVLFVTGLCLLAGACTKHPPTAAANNTQIQAPVAPPAPPAAAKPKAVEAKAAPAPAATKQAAVQPPAAAPKKLTPPQRADLNSLLAKLSDAFFDYNQATIRPDASAALGENVTAVRNILVDYPAEKLLIEGHADERGSSEYNLALADRRSRAAQEFLTTRGIPATQLRVLSYGEEKPVCTDETEACFQRNRRIHITVAP
ncbi:MAG: OmpA family protein [Acidobacteriota bacterium]